MPTDDNQGTTEQTPEEFHRNRKLGFLSNGDREFLLGDVTRLDEPDENKDGIGPQAVRQRRMRMRKKVRRALLDFSLLYASGEGVEIFRDVLSGLTNETYSESTPSEDPHLISSLQNLQGLLFYALTLGNDAPELYSEIIRDGPKMFVDDHTTAPDEAPLLVTDYQFKDYGVVPIERIENQFHAGDLCSPQLAEYLYHKDRITSEELQMYWEEVSKKPDVIKLVEWHDDVSILATEREVWDWIDDSLPLDEQQDK